MGSAAREGRHHARASAQSKRSVQGGRGMTPGSQIVGPVVDKGADLVPLPSFELAREFARQSKAENTLRGYQSDWRDFCRWCDTHALCPLPASAESVASY